MPRKSKDASVESSPSARDQSTMMFRSKSRTTGPVSRCLHAPESSTPFSRLSRLERAPARDLPFATTSWCANIAETSGSTPNQVKAPHFLSESQFFSILIQETRSDVRYRSHPTPERQTQDPFRRR